MTHLCLLGDANSPHLRRWVEEMRHRGHRVSVVTARPDASIGAEQHVLPPVARSSDWLFRVGATRRILDRLAPDIVHAHYVTSYGYLAARSGRHPLVLTAWGSDLLVTPKQSRLLHALTGWTLRRADLVTGDSADLMDAIAAYRPRAVQTLVHWGVDLARFRPSNWARKAGFEVVSLRAWERNYRVDVVIAAFARIAATTADARLHLLGGGSLEAVLRHQVNALGLGARVSFHGRLGDTAMAAVLDACKVSVSVPVSDATSVSVLESMAAGLAVVASDLPANRHWLGDDPDLLVPPGDVDALAAALGALRDDDARARAVGERHHRRMRAEGSRKTQMDRMSVLYDELAAR